MGNEDLKCLVCPSQQLPSKWLSDLKIEAFYVRFNEAKLTNYKQTNNAALRQQYVNSIFKFTCDCEFLAEAGSALVLDCDTTFITSRVSRSGRVDFILDFVFCGGRGVDEDAVPRELESMRQVRDVVVTDANLAA